MMQLQLTTPPLATIYLIPLRLPQHERINQRLENKNAVIGVIGLGYVGLPLVRAFCRGGLRVMGFDVDQAKVNKLLAGRSYIRHIPARLISSLIRENFFTPTSDFSLLRRCDR